MTRRVLRHVFRHAASSGSAGATFRLRAKCSASWHWLPCPSFARRLSPPPKTHRRRQRNRAAPLFRAQGLRARRNRHLRLLALDPHAGLQGALHWSHAARVLSRPAEQAVRHPLLGLSSALRDECAAFMGPRPAPPHGGAQRRDQHHLEQSRARRCPLRFAAARVRSDLHSRRLRLDEPRRSGRDALQLRAQRRRSRSHDVAPGRRPQRIGLPSLSRRLHGALGWPFGAGLHRWTPAGRRARPQRPSSLPLRDHRHGIGRRRIRSGPRRCGQRHHHSQRTPRSRPDDSARPRSLPIDRRRRTRPLFQRSCSLCEVDRRHPVGAFGHAGFGARQRRTHAPATRLRLHPRRSEDGRHSDGDGEQRSHLVHGRRHSHRAAGESAAPAIRILPATIRAGHESSHRFFARGLRGFAAHPPRALAASARQARSIARTGVADAVSFARSDGRAARGHLCAARRASARQLELHFCRRQLAEAGNHGTSGTRSRTGSRRRLHPADDRPHRLRTSVADSDGDGHRCGASGAGQGGLAHQGRTRARSRRLSRRAPCGRADWLWRRLRLSVARACRPPARWPAKRAKLAC